MHLGVLISCGLFLTIAAQNSGCGCEDTPPDDQFSCEQQKDFGKCGREYMRGYCECTCGTCAQHKKSNKASGVCLAVFDFDDTLKLHTPPRNAPDAESVIQQSLDVGYGVAVASASCTYEYLKSYLAENILPGFFNDQFYESNRFRICNDQKRSSLEDIIAYYGGNFDCTMFFDDSDYRWQFKDTELVYTQVVRGVGVTKENYNSANERLLNQCDCVPVA
eukprot:TRINITY_DN10313_c0_g1_i3.p1 TRINITY_DN10313_c0_g1~~TRINITY_DN10313_c0_g1_i3.p1  ORF type:complete len:220 (+),score=32.82 TRINITY_DN10313_c0_g1_i3:15-674(+)